MKLTVFERIKLLGWLGSQKGTYQQIKDAMPVLEKLELSEEEREQVGFSSDGTSLSWKDIEREFELDFSHKDIQVLADALKAEWDYSIAIGKMLEKIAKASE